MKRILFFILFLFLGWVSFFLIFPQLANGNPAFTRKWYNSFVQEMGWDTLTFTPDYKPLNSDYQSVALIRDLKRQTGFRIGQPVFIRIFKKERTLEIWLDRGDRKTSDYALFESYSICAMSGTLGPKQAEGDYQAPEGFYEVSEKQLLPTSDYHRSFNLGYPNIFDQQNKRVGSALMVHGACASAGCYAMTDEKIADIYMIVEAALSNGQQSIPVHVFPFQFSQNALADYETNQWFSFWQRLKVGYDLFNETGIPPIAYSCSGQYKLTEKPIKMKNCQRITGW